MHHCRDFDDAVRSVIADPHISSKKLQVFRSTSQLILDTRDIIMTREARRYSSKFHAYAFTQHHSNMQHAAVDSLIHRCMVIHQYSSSNLKLKSIPTVIYQVRTKYYCSQLVSQAAK
jgi:hypothetical protein